MKIPNQNGTILSRISSRRQLELIGHKTASGYVANVPFQIVDTFPRKNVPNVNLRVPAGRGQKTIVRRKTNRLSCLIMRVQSGRLERVSQIPDPHDFVASKSNR